MDIKPPIIISPQQLPSFPDSLNGMNLKLGQILEAKVIESQTILNAFTVSIADQTLSLQSQHPLNLPTNQALTLQVIKLLPSPEFKLIHYSPPPPNQSGITGQNLDAQILTLLDKLPTNTNATTLPDLTKLVQGQQFTAIVTAILDTKITVQLFPTFTPTPFVTATLPNTDADKCIITLDTKQLLFMSAEDIDDNVLTQSPVKFTSDSATKIPTASLLLLKPGMLIDLQVFKAGNSPTFLVSSPAQDSEKILIEAQKQLLPLQSPPLPLLANLQQILTKIEPQTTVSETLKQLAQDILRGIPLRSDLTEPTTLKQAIENAGVFLESKLADLLHGKQEVVLQDDIKLKLGKLAAALTHQLSNDAEIDNPALTAALEETLKKTQGTLAKLTLDQLHSLPKEESPKQGWIVELPFFDSREAQSLQIEIEQDKAGDSEYRQKNWAVSITITPPDLATIHCKVSCYDGSVNAHFWSEATDTVDRINTHLDYLKQQLEQKGLTTGFMEAHQGKPPASNTVKKPLTRLLNVKA